MLTQSLLARFSGTKNILVAGAGGGYDVLCGIPLFFALESAGHTVYLANLSSTPLNDVENGTRHTDTLLEVTSKSHRPSYFPEGWLSRWFEERLGRDMSLWCFTVSGVIPYCRSYQYLIDHLQIDAVIAVDGGVDSLLRGDEYSLASPLEDALTLAALSLITVPQKVLMATAFSAERLDNISHAQVLARIAELTKADALLGVTALLRTPDEGKRFIDSAEFVLKHQQGMHQSVVISSLLAALRGEFGDLVVNPYTQNTPPWVSPLMNLCWFFDLPEVARQNLYLPRLMNTKTFSEAAERLHDFMKTRPKRGWESIPI